LDGTLRKKRWKMRFFSTFVKIFVEKGGAMDNLEKLKNYLKGVLDEPSLKK